METDFLRLMGRKVRAKNQACFAVAPLPTPHGTVAVIVIPHGSTVEARIKGQLAGQDFLSVRFLVRALIRPGYALKAHELVHTAVRTLHPIIKTGLSLFCKSSPDSPIHSGGRGYFDDVLAAAPCQGALFCQCFGCGFIPGILVLVQLVQNQCADGLVAQTRYRA